jgi:hypothetical protein
MTEAAAPEPDPPVIVTVVHPASEPDAVICTPPNPLPAAWIVVPKEVIVEEVVRPTPDTVEF